MTLLIDVGNSAVKWGVLDDDETLGQCGRQLHRGLDDVTQPLAQAWQRLGARTAVGCTVAGRAVIAAVEAAARRAGIDSVRWAQSQPRFDGIPALDNGYREPAQLGADRWHAMLGALSCAADASIVVASAGTATTVDCVRVDPPGRGRFVGGCIAPGVRLMLEALAHGTAALPHAEGADAAFPADTDSAIVTGVLDAQAGLVERVWRRFFATVGHRPRLLLAGGHADVLAARLGELAPVIEHNLVLRGLALRARSS